jgi:hypothetical protein
MINDAERRSKNRDSCIRSYADRIDSPALTTTDTTGGREVNMKKITVRKTGTVRLTSAAASGYCHGILQG